MLIIAKVGSNLVDVLGNAFQYLVIPCCNCVEQICIVAIANAIVC